MDDEVYVVPLVHVVDKVLRLVIPALRVAHGDEADGLLVAAGSFNLRDVVRVHIRLSLNAHIVGMVVYQVTAGYQPKAGEEQEKIGSSHKMIIYQVHCRDAECRISSFQASIR